ncbi:hypothetical protein ACWA7J_01645 [Leptothrix sp. BB-4]
MNHKHKPINPRRAMKVLLSTTTLALLAWGGPAWADQPKGQFVLIQNEDPVCAPFTRNLNEFRYIDPDVCHPRLSPKYPEFSRPNWREVPFDMAIAKRQLPAWALILKINQPAQVDAGRLQRFVDQHSPKMWTTEVDIDRDSEPDRVVRIDRFGPFGEPPTTTPACIYTTAGLRFLGEPKGPLGPYDRRFSFEDTTDLIHSSVTQRTYALSWMDDMKYYRTVPGSRDFPAPKGATRGVSVRLAMTREGDEPVSGGLINVCYIAWVPTGASTKLAPDQHWRRQR